MDVPELKVHCLSLAGCVNGGAGSMNIPEVNGDLVGMPSFMVSLNPISTQTLTFRRANGVRKLRIVISNCLIDVQLSTV
jgi:hypothetical protein